MKVLSKWKKRTVLSRFLSSFSVFALFACLFATNCSSGELPGKFRFAFDGKGRFKIVQFTDLHWGGASGVTRDVTPTIVTIRSILEIEKPDFAVITGDITNSREALSEIAAIFEEAKTPFTITLGNHDGEAKYNITRPEIFDHLMPLPYFVGDKGPEEITGTGNFVIPVYGRNGKTTALLYCFDSNSYSTNPRIGKSDVIHFDQVQWYRGQSDGYALLNNGKPLPSLAFFHIPLPEHLYLEDKIQSPDVRKDISDPVAYNTGLFASFVEKEDIMGVFVGHEHNRDYVGIERGIMLGYGRLTGWNASAHGPDPNIERGARIIELYEGEFMFDTWLRTAQGVEQEFHYQTNIAP